MNAWISPALLVAEQLLSFRRSIAPPGSRREGALRRVYIPLVHHLRKRRMARMAQRIPHADVTVWESPRNRAAERPRVRRILVLKLDHIGDFITGLPALAELRAGFPNASITLVCGSWNADWARKCGLADEVVVFNYFSRSSAEGRSEETTLASFDALRLGNFDLAIDLRHDPDTRILLTRVAAGFRAGFHAPAEMGGAVLDLALPDVEHLAHDAGAPIHAQLRLELLVRAVTGLWMHARHPAHRLVSPATVAPATRYAILAPGAGSPIRCWPLDRLIAVGQELIEQHGLSILIVGSPEEQADAAILAAALPAGRVRNLAGIVGLPELPSVISRASLYVGYDTGTTHLAAALDVPTLAIVGAIGETAVWHPDGSRVAVLASRIACGGCYLKQVSDCPFDVRCMTAISVEHALAACNSLLAGAAPAPFRREREPATAAA